MKRMLTIVLAMICTNIMLAQDAKMNAYVSNLMSKMTVEEKIGQLNLVIPGGAVTGSVVSKDVDNKIRAGNVGGLFGITGPDKVRQAQDIAVKETAFTYSPDFWSGCYSWSPHDISDSARTLLFLGYRND